MAVYHSLKGIWPLKERIQGALDPAKIHSAAEPILLICEPGCASAVPSGHGSVYNAPHHVSGVVDLYAASVWKGEPSVALG